MFSWDNSDVHDMIDRYVKATYFPHLGVKARYNETSASEIAAVIKKKYGVVYSRHSVRHQFEKHRRTFKHNTQSPTVRHKRKVEEAPSRSESPVSSTDQDLENKMEEVVEEEPNTLIQNRQITQRIIHQLMYPSHFIPRPQHFEQMTGGTTWKVRPDEFTNNDSLKQQQWDQRSLEDINPDDILPFHGCNQ